MSSPSLPFTISVTSGKTLEQGRGRHCGAQSPHPDVQLLMNGPQGAQPLRLALAKLPRQNLFIMKDKAGFSKRNADHGGGRKIIYFRREINKPLLHSFKFAFRWLLAWNH